MSNHILLRRRLLRIARETHPDADTARVAAAVDNVIAERVTASERPILDFLTGETFIELLRFIAAILAMFADVKTAPAPKAG